MNSPQNSNGYSAIISFYQERVKWHNAIRNYQGSDPLELWYHFLNWYEKNSQFDQENKLTKTMQMCLNTFENHEVYKQDSRMYQIWMKFIEHQPNPVKYFSALYERGIGTRFADFYKRWAALFDQQNAFKQVDTVFNYGLQARAHPIEELQEAYTKFRSSLAYRMNGAENGAHLKRPISSTDDQVFHQNQSQVVQKRQRVENESYTYGKNNSVTGEQCNLNNSANVISSSLSYVYGEPQSNNYDYNNVSTDMNSTVEGNFNGNSTTINGSIPIATYAKNNHEDWSVPLCLEEPHDPNRVCYYPKKLVYPGDGSEYSLEEIRWNKRMAINSPNQMNYCASEGQMNGGMIYGNSAYPNYSSVTINAQSDNASDSLYGIDPGISENCNNNFMHSNEYNRIEASTISFNTDDNGVLRPKKLTIKFRKASGEFETAKRNNAKKSKKYRIVSSYDDDSNTNCSVNNSSNSSSQDMFEKKKYYTLNNSTIISNGELNYQNSFNHLIEQENPHDQDPYARATDPSRSTAYERLNNNRAFNSFNTSSTPIRRDVQMNGNRHLNLDSVGEDASFSNVDFVSTGDSVGENSNSSFGFANSISTPIRSSRIKNSSDFLSKTITPNNFKILRKRTSVSSNQNDDSMSSLISAEQNSFFAAEHDDDLKQRRVEKALSTITTHLAKPNLDPFNSELCKAFLTKLNFPSVEHSAVCKLISTSIPKLNNTKVAQLANVPFNIEKEIGRGAYGSVFRATNAHTGDIVALKYQKTTNVWEVYISMEVKRRLRNHIISSGFMDITSAIIAPNASIFVTEFSQFGSLLDVNNRVRQATTKVMHESLVMHFAMQILDIVHHLHSCNIIHADIKPDNFLLMRIPNPDQPEPSIRLIDFGCAIDMNQFEKGKQFKKIIQTDGFTCTEMLEGRPWSYQTDLFCVAGTVHVLLFCDYMQLQKKFGSEWDIKQKLPRYLKKHIWTDFFSKLLNIKSLDKLPNLCDMKKGMHSELHHMESELQKQIRTLSNILHKR